MFDELKNLPQEQKRLLKVGISVSSALFLSLCFCMFIFKDDVMEYTAMDSFTIDMIAVAMCCVVVVDLYLLKVILGEDKAK